MAIYEEKKPVTATVYPKNGNSYTGYVIDGKTYKDAAGTQRIDAGSSVQMADGRSFTYNPATQVKTVDQSGNVGAGYIKDGVTYADADATKRVAPGTTVYTNGGAYMYGGEAIGGVPTAATAKNNYQKSYNDAIGLFGEATKAQNDAIDAAVKAALADYDFRKGQIQENTAKINKEAEEAYIKASNPYGPIAQRLEALGLGDSGYAETTYARLGNEYQKQLSENNRAMSMAIAEIDRAITRAKYDGDIEKANLLAAEKQKIAAMQMEMNANIYSTDVANLSTALSRMDAAEEREYNRAWAEKEYADAQAAVEYQKKQDAINQILSGHITPENAALAGTDVAGANQMFRDYVANQLSAQPKKAASSGGGTKKTAKSPDPDGLYEAYKAMGDVDAETFASAYWKTFNFDNAKQAELALSNMEAADGGENPVVNLNDLGSEYSSIWQNARRMKDRGKTQAEIVAYLDTKKEGDLSDEGIIKILQNLGFVK